MSTQEVMAGWGKYLAIVEPQSLASGTVSDETVPAGDALDFREAVFFLNIGTIVVTGVFTCTFYTTAAADEDPNLVGYLGDDLGAGPVPNSFNPNNDNALYFWPVTLKDPANLRYIRAIYDQQNAAGAVAVTVLLVGGVNQNPPIGASGAEASYFTAPSFEV